MTACTSMQIVQSSPQQNLAGQLSAGDDVSLVTRDGKHYDLAITHVDANSLTGQDAHGKKWKVRREAIASLEVRRFSTGKTAGLSAAIVAGVYVVGALAIAIAANSISEGFEKMFGGYRVRSAERRVVKGGVSMCRTLC